MPTPTTLKRGDKGPAVLALQGRLHTLGFLKAKPDGEFGPITEQAVLAFQDARDLDMDGIAGPATQAALAGPEPVKKPAPPASKPSAGVDWRVMLLSIARRDVGKIEKPRNNQGEWIKKFWPATTYPEGYADRQPYCAAACCYWLKTLGEELAAAGVLEQVTGMNAEQYEKWRCKSAGAWAWQDWAKKAKGVTVLPDSAKPEPGDVVVYDFSHVGLIEAPAAKSRINTIEANTGPSGERDGDGCWQKNRPQEIARAFLRLNFKV